jgi:glycerol-3-phosphate dehydrogenase
VGLVEAEDFAAGTSSRSSKIVHGGVRYLEYGHFLLVRESARERTVLRSIAPHLVHRLEFLFPVFAPDSVMKVRAGLSIFDWMADADGLERHVHLGPAEVRERLPGLRDPLKGAVLYPEFITDDARLTLENALSAAEHGARVANHARAEELLRSPNGVVIGARVRDGLTGRVHRIEARCVVNAGGPWVQAILESSGLTAPKAIRPSKGIHLLLSAERLPIVGATFLKASNGRRGLAMRRLNYVYIGTSDDEYHGPLDAPRATRAEVVELLAMAQDCFPSAGLTVDDVLATWAGVRPLLAEEGKSTRDTSREDEVWRDVPGLVTVAGGKLTTYRRMAGRVIEAVRRELGPAPDDRDRTAEVLLPGADRSADEWRGHSRRDALEDAGLSRETVDRLTWLYGRQIDDLIELGRDDPEWLSPLGDGVPAVRGEARLAAEREMAATLVDFMDRRSALLLFSPNFGLGGAEEAATVLGSVLGWDAKRRDAELERYRVLAEEHRVPET